MKVLIQRVTRAKVSTNQKVLGSIDSGLLVLLGICKGDSEDDVKKLSKKIVQLRIFSDEEGKMNLSTQDVRGSILLVSQFTLCAETSHGNRPSYINSEEPKQAKSLYQLMIKYLNKYLPTETGEFGANMQIELVNDGPVTIFLDTRGT